MRAHFGVDQVTPASFPGGAAVAADGRGWVLVETDVIRSLGKAMAWARQQQVAELHLLAEADAGALARRAALFADSATVWWVHGAELHATEPEPFTAPPPAPDPGGFGPLLRGVGLQVVHEYDHVAGELRGLEVARVTDGRLEVGVGEADRELTAMLHGDLAPADALERVATIVGQHRRPGAPRHPLNQLAPERWLRWTLHNEPSRIGVDRVDPAPSPRPRVGLRERDVACGRSSDSVVVCSVGVDLDLVPSAAEARLVLDPDAPLLLAVPERDDHPATRALAAQLRSPATVVTVAGDWRT